MATKKTETETEATDTEAADTSDGRSFRVEGNDLSAYVGVSPEYQNYAEETHKPSFGEGVEAKGLHIQQDSDDLNIQDNSDFDPAVGVVIPAASADPDADAPKADPDPADNGEPSDTRISQADRDENPDADPTTFPSITPPA